MKWKTKRIELKSGLYFSILKHEGNKKDTILFLHGLGTAKEDFLESIKYLSEYNLLLVDLLGHGKSAKPSEFNYSMKKQAEMLLKLLNKLSISNNITLLAHSMGGPIAIYLAELLENKPKALIYAEGNIDFNDCFGSNAIISSGNLEEWIARNFEKTVSRLKKGTSSDYAKTFEIAGPLSTYLSSKNLVKISKKGKLVNRILNLNIPFLPIYGELNKDKFTSEKKLAEYFSIVYISNSEHDMMISNPEEFYTEINKFLKNIENSI